MLNPWLQPSQMDPFNDMSAEHAFRDSMQLTRQDSLEDALQLINRDRNNGLFLSELQLQPQPPVDQPSFFDGNNLDFEHSLNDLSNYDLLNLPTPLENDFGQEEFNKEQGNQYNTHLRPTCLAVDCD
jgi:hypothetical protein